MFNQKNLLLLIIMNIESNLIQYYLLRNDDSIIEHLKEVILSAQRDKFFTIKVKGFRVIEDYREIYNILYDTKPRQETKESRLISLIILILKIQR